MIKFFSVRKVSKRMFGALALALRIHNTASERERSNARSREQVSEREQIAREQASVSMVASEQSEQAVIVARLERAIVRARLNMLADRLLRAQASA